MSRKWMACLAMSFAMSVISGQDSFAGGLDKEEREEVSKIVAAAVSEAKTELGKEIKDSKNELLAEIKKLTTPAATTPAADATLLLTALQKISSQNATPPETGFDAIFKEAFARAKQCENIERTRKVLRNVIGVSDGDKCSSLNCNSALCEDLNGDGEIDINELFKCEEKRLKQAEELDRLRKVFRGILSDDKCEDKCKTSGVSYYAPNYCPPGYAPVVLESASPSYYRYVKCD